MLTTIDQTTVLPLPIRPAATRTLERKLQRALMVAWINADLMNRAANDVTKSVVFYDEHGDFVYAVRLESMDSLTDAFLQRLYNETSIRFYSKGVK